MKDLFWGGLLIAIGLVNGASIFLGDFTLFNLFFDALGTWWLSRGVLGLWQRRQAGGRGRVPDGVDPGIAQAAGKILSDIQASYRNPANLSPVQAAQFRHLDLHRYENCGLAMEKRGYRWLGDFEHLAVNRSKTSLLAPTMLRAWASADGQVAVFYTQVRPHLPRRIQALLVGLSNLRWIAAPRDFQANLKMRQCVDVETEFDDGSFLVTSNASVAAVITMPASIQTDFHPGGTSLPDLLSRHQGQLARILHEGRRRPVPVRTAGDLLNMQKRLAAQKLAHRESVHWVTKEELRTMAGGNRQLADAIHAEVRRQLAAGDSRLPAATHTSPSML